MRIVRYQDQDGRVHYGSEGPGGEVDRIEGDVFGAHRVTSERAQVAKLLAPVVPTSIICIGLNYRRHAEEGGMPVPERPIVFCKGNNTLQHPGDPILIPTHAASTEVDYECELAVVIGKAGKNIRRADALKHVLGYTCANDVSARDWQLKWGGGQWCRGKFFDTFCPLGPALVTPDEIPDPNTLRIGTVHNGRVVQNSNTSDMIFDVPHHISFLSGSTTLLPGMVILTGTPQGVGMAMQPPLFLKPGDEVTIEIEQIGTLTNPVALET